MKTLDENNLARLHTKLVVPFAVGDIIKGNQDITPDIQYALHESLSEMDPDTALLAIALSASYITAQLCPEIPVACALSLEGQKVIDEYGADWLAHADGRMPSREGDALFEALEHIPEDLEGLAELLDTLSASLHESYGAVKEVAYILSIQARAHSEIAEFVLSELQGTDIQSTSHVQAESLIQADNVILFPTSTSVH